mgnify:CR=1 FL=1
MDFLKQVLNNEINLHTFYKKLIIKIINNEIKNMIFYCSSKYNSNFNIEDAKKMYKKYKIKDIKQLSETKKIKINKRIQKKILYKKFKKQFSLNKINFKNKNSKNFSKNDIYCNARTWDNGSIINCDTAYEDEWCIIVPA